MADSHFAGPSPRSDAGRPSHGEREAAPSVIVPPAPQLEAEFETVDIIEAAEALLRAGAPHDFEILVLGGGCAGIAAARRAAELGATVGLIDAHLAAGNGALDEAGRVPLDMVLDAWHDAILAQRTLRSLEEIAPREPRGPVTGNPLTALALWRRAALEAEKRRTARRRLLEESGVRILPGRARFLDEHTVELLDVKPQRNERRTRKRGIRAVHIIVATGAGAAPAGSAPFLHPELAVVPSRESFEMLLGAAPDEALAVIGGDSTALEWAALLRAGGARVSLFRGDAPLWCDAAVRAGDDLLREAGVACGALTPHLALEAEDGRVRMRGAGRAAPHRFAAVLWTDRAVDAAALNLEAAGIECEDGRIAVDARGETAVSGVFAAGACAGFDCDAALAVAQGARLAETILRAPDRTPTSQTPRRLRLVPELAAVGLSESDALALDVSAHSVEGRWGKNRHLRLVADESGFLLGCQACGDGAGDLVRQSSIALRAGWTAAHWAKLLPETSAAPWLVALRETARKLG